jgi:hypothetical protein
MLEMERTNIPARLCLMHLLSVSIYQKALMIYLDYELQSSEMFYIHALLDLMCFLLAKLGAQVILVAPPTLLPVGVESWPCAISYDLDEVIAT